MQFAEMGEVPLFFSFRHKLAPKWLYHLLLQYGKDLERISFFDLIYSSSLPQ